MSEEKATPDGILTEAVLDETLTEVVVDETPEHATKDLLIEADQRGVWLTALSNQVNMVKVIHFLETKGIRNYNEKVVKEFVIKNTTHTPWRVADRDEAAERRAFVSVHVTDDSMTASVTVDPPFFAHPWPTVNDIKESLAHRGVIYGLKENVIEKIVKLRIANEAIVVAEGTPPQNGENASIEVLVDPDKPVELDQEAEKVDYREISAFVYVKEGQEVAIMHPPTAGESGTSVLGEEIKPKPGSDMAFLASIGLNTSEDGLHLIAALDGRLAFKDNRLSVLPELEIDGDVHFKTGNIDFTGYVKIKGDVKDGFKVVSAGDVEVKGLVEGSYIKSAGNITISGGVRAMGKGRLIAAGNISASFVDQAYMRSGGNIIVKNSILHSDVGAAQAVRVKGGAKSQIVGGRILAGMEVICQTLGSEAGTKTEVVVGILPEQVERRQELKNLIEKGEADLAKAETDWVFLKKMETVGVLTEKGQQQKISLMKMKFQLQSSLITMKNELQSLEDLIEMYKERGIVRIKNICYPGVKIVIRGAVYKVESALKFAAFVFRNGEVALKSFDF
jgi:uncharacterized protein (DUF342 family)